MRTHRADHELPDLGDARAVHVGGEQQEHQERVQEDGLHGAFRAYKPGLDAEAHRVQRARVAEQGVREDADARRVHHDAQDVGAKQVDERGPVEDVRDVGHTEEEDRETRGSDYVN